MGDRSLVQLLNALCKACYVHAGDSTSQRGQAALVEQQKVQAEILDRWGLAADELKHQLNAAALKDKRRREGMERATNAQACELQKAEATIRNLEHELTRARHTINQLRSGA